MQHWLHPVSIIYKDGLQRQEIELVSSRINVNIKQRGKVTHSVENHRLINIDHYEGLALFLLSTRP